MKQGFIHITFVIDKSGSMYSKVADVIGGFNSFIQEQKDVKEGETEVSIYTFNDKVQKTVVNTNIDDISLLTEETYVPGGNTALNDALGTAINETGAYLASLNEEDRPSKVIIVVMTDGAENSSKEFTRDKVKEMITRQEEKYSWTFVSDGNDMTRRLSSNIDRALGYDDEMMSNNEKIANNSNEVEILINSLKTDVKKIFLKMLKIYLRY